MPTQNKEFVKIVLIIERGMPLISRYTSKDSTKSIKVKVQRKIINRSRGLTTWIQKKKYSRFQIHNKITRTNIVLRPTEYDNPPIWQVFRIVCSGDPV